MKRNYWYTGLSKWFMKNIIGPTGVRAKDSRGRYIKDDKSTPDVNEAYKDGLKPKRKTKAKGKPKKRGRPKGSKNKKK